MASTNSRSEIVLALAEEFLDRYRRGERPALKEYVDRHPELEADIREAFPAMAMMENIALAEESIADNRSRDKERAEVLQQLGDYRIIREVGRGGMGVVYEAEQVSLGRHVALKVLPRKMLLDPKQRRRFEREAKAAAKLHHTNIVPVFGVGEQDGLPYYVMQFIQGLGLDEVLREVRRLRGVGDGPAEGRAARDPSAAAVARSLITGTFDVPSRSDSGPPSPAGATRTHQPAVSADHHEAADSSGDPAHPAHQAHSAQLASGSLSGSSISLPGQTDVAGRTRSGRKPSYWQSVAQIGLQVAEALDYAHRQGVQHRDIKPSNLLLDLRGTVWVTDFGLAKADDSENLTHTGDILGTLRYMPPEAFEGRGDTRADVYALGITLYELLALRPAFGEKDRNQLVKQVIESEVPRLRKVNAAVPRDLQTIVHKAIEKDPAHRYGSAGQLAEDLRRFLDDEPIHARTVSVPERAWRWCRRNPAMAGLIAAVVFVTLGGFAASTYQAAVARGEARRADANAGEAEANAAKAVASAAEAQARADELQDANERLRVQQEQQRRNAYANQLNLIPPTAAAENFPQVRNLLAKSRPLAGQDDLRGWEWSYWTRQMHPEATAIRLADSAALAGAAAGAQFIPSGLSPDLYEQYVNARFGMGSTWHLSDDGGRIALALDGPVLFWDSKDGRRLQPPPGTGPPNPDQTPAAPPQAGANRRDGQPGAANAVAADSKAAGTQTGAQGPAPRTDSNKAGLKGGQGKQPTARDKSKGPPAGSKSGGFGSSTRTGALSRDGRRFAEFVLPGRGFGENAPPAATLRVRDLDGAREPYVEPVAAAPGPALSNRLAFDADGARLAVTLVSGGLANPTCELAVYDLTARRLVVRKAVDGFARIDLVAFLPDLRQILVSGPLPVALPGRGAVPPVPPPPLSPARARTVIVDAQTAEVLSEVVIAANALVLAVSPDGTRVAAQAQVQFPAPRGGIRMVPMVGPAPELKVYERASGQELRAIPVPGGISSVCFSADGKRLAGVTPQSWVVHVWDVESGTELYTFRGQATAVNRIAFTPDGTRLVSLDRLGTVKTWDLTAQPDRVAMPVQTGTGRFDPNASTLIAAASFEVSRDGRRAMELLGKANRAGPGGRGVTTNTLTITVRDDQGRVLSQLEHPMTAAAGRSGRGAHGTAFSPDGSKFAVYLPPSPPVAGAPPAGPQPRSAARWEVRTATGQTICELQWPAGRSPDSSASTSLFAAPPPCRLSPDGRLLAVVNGAPANRAVVVFGADSGKALAELPATEFAPTSLAFSPDGELLAIAGANPTPAAGGAIVSVVDLLDGAEWARFALPRRAITSLTFSPDGRWLAGYSNPLAGFGGGAAGGLPEVYVWDTDSDSAEPRVLSGHTASIRDLAFTPDGNRLATLGPTQAGRSEVKIWDPATGQELLTLTEPTALVAVRFSADGHKLYVFDGETRRAYDATPLPPAIEALDVVDHLPPAETKAELDAQIAKFSLAPDLRAKVAELARVTPAMAGGRGGWGGGPGAGGASPLSTMFRPGLAEGEYRSALETVELNIQIQGPNALWLVRKGGSLYRLRQYDEAIEILEKARAAGPAVGNPNVAPTAFLAMTYHRQGQAAKAKAELDRMYKELQTNPPSFTSPTNIYRQLFIEAETLVAGKSSGMIEAIPITARVGGDFESGRDGSEITPSNSMYSAGQDGALYKAALEQADRARSALPDNGTVWLRYGGLLYRLGRYDDAIGALVKARDVGDLVPNAVAAPSAFLAMTYHRQGQAAKAKAELDRMYKELPNAAFNSPTNFYRLFYLEAEALVAGKSSGVIEAMPIGGPREGPAGRTSPLGVYRFGLNEADYRQVWEAAQALKSDTGGMGWLRSGGALYRLGRFQDALVELHKARELGGLSPVTGPAPTAFLAMTYHRLGQTDKAKDELARLRREMKEEPYAGARVSATYVNFYAEAEAVVEGKDIGTSRREDGAFRPGQEHLVIYRPNRPKEEYERALPELEAGKSIGRTTTQWYRYGGVLYRLGRYDEALTALTRAAEIPPQSTATTPYPSMFLAMTYHKLGRPEEAKAALAKMRASLATEEWTSRRATMNPDIVACFAEAEALVDPKK